uniref:Tc1-like transposase DDE domain-containing protein n=1 Tax=Plectus sambesii TaxID=2011161 RepID=A0A914XMG5_9BILA
MTPITGMSYDGFGHRKIISNGIYSGVKFCAFIPELAARLREREEMNGAWLIWDNAYIHKTRKLQENMAGSSYELKFLSLHSYMLNPAENVFLKVKASAKRVLSDPVAQQTLRSAFSKQRVFCSELWHSWQKVSGFRRNLVCWNVLG